MAKDLLGKEIPPLKSIFDKSPQPSTGQSLKPPQNNHGGSSGWLPSGIPPHLRGK